MGPNYVISLHTLSQSSSKIEVSEGCLSVFSGSHHHDLTLFSILIFINIMPIIRAHFQQLLKTNTVKTKNNQVISTN